MKTKTFTIIHYSLLIALLALIGLTQRIPAMGEAYSRHVYPPVSTGLSFLSGAVPFSVGDLFIVLSIAGLVAYPFRAWRKGKKGRKIVLNMVTYLAWVYVWFYLAWGLNYSQYNFYQRTGVPYSPYSPENFEAFVYRYTDSLNASYTPIGTPDKKRIQQEVIRAYHSPDKVGVRSPGTAPRAKNMLCAPLMSKMGVSGYMNPFFCEFHVNRDVPPSQYPATYAHELAHFLGISSEAEANFHAYIACTHSDVPEIRFCGYFSVMNHVLRNAEGFMDEESYIALISRIRPEIIQLAIANREHWQQLYSPAMGKMQSRIYDFYLKGNKIESGRKNYSEVVGLLISWYAYEINLPI